MRIAHISDTHFGTEDDEVCTALRRDLLRDAPDLVVLSGDITQRARRAQFDAARAFLDSLAPLPVLALPGNHDLPLFDLFTRFTGPYRRFRKTISATLAPVWQGQEVIVLGVNSTRVWRHKHGVLSERNVLSIARHLEGSRHPFKVVVLHHPLAYVEESDRCNCARGATQALVTWAQAGADLILGGHIHLPYCLSAGVAPYRTVVLQAGTAVSTRRRGGQANSFNLIHFETSEADASRRMVIEQRDYDAPTRAFRAARVNHAQPSADGWTVRVESV